MGYFSDRRRVVRFAIFFLLTVTLLGGIVLFLMPQFMALVFAPNDTAQTGKTLPSELPVASGEAFPAQTTSTEPTDTPSNRTPQVVAQNLNIPWDLVFLPDGTMLVTERGGRLLHFTDPQNSIPVNGVVHRGEGGLMGLVLHPEFATNNWLYLYFTSQGNDGLINRIERYTFKDNQLSNQTTIIGNLPGAQYHDGGRMAFGPDGHLYIATGDASKPDLAQDTNSLAGKILRVTADGSPAPDNPFNNAVYSYGHRNPQGLAWDQDGQLWVTEHGPSGNETGYDEVNRIEAGKNYGWPTIRGDQTQEGMVTAVKQSGSNETWAPGGAAITNDTMWFAGLRGQKLYQMNLSAPNEPLTGHFAGELGRLRTVVLGPDNWLYLLTSNRDGRGEPKPNDDKIIRVPVEWLETR